MYSCPPNAIVFVRGTWSREFTNVLVLYLRGRLPGINFNPDNNAQSLEQSVFNKAHDRCPVRGASEKRFLPGRRRRRWYPN